MNVLDFYNDRIEEVTINHSYSTKVLILRRGKSMSPTTIADSRMVYAAWNTPIQAGDLVSRSNGEEFFIVARQSSSDCVQMQGRRVNAKVELFDMTEKFVNHKKVGIEATLLRSDVPVYYSDVSAQMKTYDAGLLPTTVKKIIIDVEVDVKLLHRIRLNGNNYQINNIDTGKYVGLYELQVGEDTRK